MTLVGVLALGGLVAIAVFGGSVQGESMPDGLKLIGRFHPVLLHLPIGVMVMVLLQELGAIFSKKGGEVPASLFPIGFAAFSSVLAVVAGFLLYHGEDFTGSDLAARHLWGGLVFSICAVLTLVMKAWTVGFSWNPAWYRLFLFITMGVMIFASHDGASLTHGKGYLTKYAPDPVRSFLGLEERVVSPPAPAEPVEAAEPAEIAAEEVAEATEPETAVEEEVTELPALEEPVSAAAADPVVYADVVAPIFERRCVSCHNEDKAKGKLRMDGYEFLLKGGKEGACIEPGSAKDSNVMFRIDLPEDDDEHMPPEGKPDLVAAEYLVLKWWLDRGASPDAKVSELAPAEEVLKAIEEVSKLPTE
ncbi:MAG: c-type cytochrome domain-containing protein [Verrucomicrobiales bacterium]